jgi:hypothetical protein
LRRLNRIICYNHALQSKRVKGVDHGRPHFKLDHCRGRCQRRPFRVRHADTGSGASCFTASLTLSLVAGSGPPPSAKARSSMRRPSRSQPRWGRYPIYFAPAVQLGLTATPKRKDNVDTYAYFGEPVYIYSLKEGINDGFLTPFANNQRQDRGTEVDVAGAYNGVFLSVKRLGIDRVKRLGDKALHTLTRVADEVEVVHRLDGGASANAGRTETHCRQFRIPLRRNRTPRIRLPAEARRAGGIEEVAVAPSLQW